MSIKEPAGRSGHPLVTNLVTLAHGAQVEAIWDCEDEEPLAAANRLVENYTARKATKA
jgi:hypothetical protein